MDEKRKEEIMAAANKRGLRVAVAEGMTVPVLICGSRKPFATAVTDSGLRCEVAWETVQTVTEGSGLIA